VVCPAEVATEIFGDPKNVPPDAISIDQAGIEILDGIEQGKLLLPIVDTARRIYRDTTENPAANEQFLHQMFNDTLAGNGMTVKQFHDKVITEI